MNTKLSAHAKINGSFGFNATPLAPPGTKIVIHEKPGVRGSCPIRGIDGWYIGYAPVHYICFWVYANKTLHSRIADTVEFFHTTVICLLFFQWTMPSVQSKN